MGRSETHIVSEPTPPVHMAHPLGHRSGYSDNFLGHRSGYSDNFLANELVDYFAEEEDFHRLTEPLRKRRGAPTADPAGADAHDPFDAEFGDYELLERIGQGGMGVVFKARQISLNRPVAVKMVRAGRLATEEDVKRFYNEVEAIADLDHPQIVPIYEVGKHDGRDYFAMKLIEGTSLASCLGRFQSDPKRAARLMAMVARAIHHAHQRGVLHRDLKPSNILIDAEGQPYVSDFGLAKRIKGAADLTESEAMPGTPRYMAPEQASGARGAVTTATDIHGLGAILYAILTGRAPFQGDSVPEVLEQVKNHEPDPPSSINRRVDRDLQTICLKCLEKEPASRYGSALALAEDLERWDRGEPIAARPVGPVVKGWRWARRNKFVASLLGLVGALLIAGIAGLVVGNAMLVRKNTEILRRTNQTRQAVDDMYTQVAEQLLPDLPGKEQVRREFLLKALKYYEEEASEGNGADAAAREARANAYVRVGRIHYLLSEKDLPAPAFRSAIALWEELVKDYPNQSNHRMSLARSLNLLGLQYWIKGRGPEAVQLYRRSLDTLGNLAEDTSPDFREVMASNLHMLAVLYQELGDLAKAEASSRGAMKLREDLAAKFPANAAYQHDRALCRGASAGLLADPRWRPPRPDEAERAFQQALDIEEKLVVKFPSNSKFCTGAADLQNNLGEFLLTRGRHRDAEALFRRALSEREALASRYPDVPDSQARLGEAVLSLAGSLRDQGRYPEATALAKRAITHHKTALNASPDHPFYLTWLRADYVLMAETLLSQGDSEKASEAAEAAIRVVPDGKESFYYIAAAYARCVPRLEKLPNLDEARRRVLARTYADQAMEMLRQAVKRGCVIEDMEKDTDFDALRGARTSSCWDRPQVRPTKSQLMYPARS